MQIVIGECILEQPKASINANISSCISRDSSSSSGHFAVDLCQVIPLGYSVPFTHCHAVTTVSYADNNRMFNNFDRCSHRHLPPSLGPTVRTRSCSWAKASPALCIILVN